MFRFKVKNLAFKYKNGNNEDYAVLKDINFSINSGDFLGIIGENGSGKSTLLKIIAGLLRPSSGKVLLNNVEIFKYLKDKRENRFNIGIVFQNPEEQLFEKTLYEDIAFAPKNMNLNATEIENRILSAAKFVNLSRDKLFLPIGKISGGEKRKAAIAGVIAMNPKVLILDEPTAGLDHTSSKEFFKNIKKYNEETKSTVILVSHNLEDILRYASKILVLNNGTVSIFCKTKEIFLNKNLKKIEPYLIGPCKVLVSLKNKGYNICDLNNEIFTDIDKMIEVIFNSKAYTK